MKSAFYTALMLASTLGVANAQSLYSIASPVGLDESLPLNYRATLAFGYDDNVNAVPNSSPAHQDSSYARFSVLASASNWDARTQYSFDLQLGGIFYLESMDFGTDDVMSDISFRASLVQNFDSTLRYVASAGISYMPEPDYSSGITVGSRAGEYLHAFFDNSINKAWDSRFSTSTGFNVAMLHYSDDYAKIDNRRYVRLLQSFRYKWDLRSAALLSWRGEYADRRYGRDALNNFVSVGYEYALTKFTNLSVNVGPQFKHTNGLNSHTSLFASVGVNHRLTDRSTLGLFFRREDESTNTYQSGRNYGTNQTYRLGVNGSYALNHVFTLDGGVNWIHSAYRRGETGLDNRTTRIYNITAGLSYKATRNLSLRLGYSYTNGDNSFGNYNGKYNRNIYSLAATYNF